MKSTQLIPLFEEQAIHLCTQIKNGATASMLIGIAAALLAGAPALAADLSGDWEFAAKSLGETNFARVNLKVEGNKITGRLNELKLEGTVKGDEITFKAKRPNGDHFGDFTGKAKGNELEGTAVWFGERK